MASIKLSYCQLIKIILAQLGGNPLQQVFTQLTQGMPSISVRSGLFSELAQIKQVVDEVTNRIQQLVKDVNDYEKLAREMANQFMKNPMATAINELIAQVDAKITALEGAGDTSSEQYTSYVALKANLQQYLDITNKLSGVSPASGGQTCGLADLLGNGCTPAKNIPDIDLRTLVNSLNKQNLVNALKSKIATGTGFDQLATQIAELNNTITNIRNSFTNIFSKQFIKNAVAGYINQIIFQLLSGCGNDVMALTLKDYTGDSFSGFDSIFSLSGLSLGGGSSGSKSISISGDLSNVVVGQTVTGTNVLSNTKIVEIYEANGTIVLSNTSNGIISNNISFTFSNVGSNLSIANAIIEATAYLQNIYGSGNVIGANGYVGTDGNVVFYSNIQDTLNITETGI